MLADLGKLTLFAMENGPGDLTIENGDVMDALPIENSDLWMIYLLNMVIL